MGGGRKTPSHIVWPRTVKINAQRGKKGGRGEESVLKEERQSRVFFFLGEGVIRSLGV